MTKLFKNTNFAGIIELYMPKQNTKERERNYLNNINLENFKKN